MEAVIESVPPLMVVYEAMDKTAHFYASSPLFPLFTIVHFIITACALRSEPGSLQFAFKHPVGSCVMTFFVASSGTILTNLMLGQPLLDCLTNEMAVFSGILVWYLIFFSPFDVFYYLCKITPVWLLLNIVEELGKAKKIMAAVEMAFGVYNAPSLLAVAVVAMFKGSGKCWSITLYRLVYYPRSAGTHELLGLSYITKASFILGLIFACNLAAPFAAKDHLLILGGLFLTALKLWNILVKPSDPFNVPQQIIWQFLTLLSFTPPPWSTTPPLRSTTPPPVSASKEKEKSEPKHLKSE